jgi:hypothetical protein
MEGKAEGGTIDAEAQSFASEYLTLFGVAFNVFFCISVFLQLPLKTFSEMDGVRLWWTGRDLNPRLQRCQRCDRSRLIYPPIVILNRAGKLLSVMGRSESPAPNR